MPDILIPGATNPIYRFVAADVGNTIFCVNSLAVGPIEAAGPVPVPPSIITAPLIADDTPEIGEVLSSTPGTWAGDTPLTYSYEWHRVTPGTGEPVGLLLAILKV